MGLKEAPSKSLTGLLLKSWSFWRIDIKKDDHRVMSQTWEARKYFVMKTLRVQPILSPWSLWKRTRITIANSLTSEYNEWNYVSCELCCSWERTCFEEQKIVMFKEIHSNSLNEYRDYNFLMSLLAYLKNVPQQRKMFVRTKLQQAFCEEDILGKHRGQHPPTNNLNVSVCGSSTGNESGRTDSQLEIQLSPEHVWIAFFISITFHLLN